MTNFSEIYPISARTVQAINYILDHEPGLKKKDLASRLGIKQTKLSEVLSGKSKPTETLIASLCREYPISGNWIIFGKGDMLSIGDDENINQFPFSSRIDILQRLETILRIDGSSVPEYEKEHSLFPGTFDNARKRGTPRIVAGWVFSILQEHPDFSIDWTVYGVGDMKRDGSQTKTLNDCSSEEMKNLSNIISEKDAIISKKDEIINCKDGMLTQRDATIANLYSIIEKLSNNKNQ